LLPIFSTDPLAPIESTDPLDPIDRTDPLDPIDSSDPDEPRDKALPADSALMNDITLKADQADNALPHEALDAHDFFPTELIPEPSSTRCA
jgi:hypothetical protein